MNDRRVEKEEEAQESHIILQCFSSDRKLSFPPDGTHVAFNVVVGVFSVHALISFFPSVPLGEEELRNM